MVASGVNYWPRRLSRDQARDESSDSMNRRVGYRATHSALPAACVTRYAPREYPVPCHRGRVVFRFHELPGARAIVTADNFRSGARNAEPDNLPRIIKSRRVQARCAGEIGVNQSGWQCATGRAWRYQMVSRKVNRMSLFVKCRVTARRILTSLDRSCRRLRDVAPAPGPSLRDRQCSIVSQCR
jgi:hypothetical protein